MFDHGTNPTGQTYSYVLLPGTTSTQVASYASHPDITVLENSSAAHAANTLYDFKIVARPSNDTFDLYINNTQVVFNQSFRNAVASLDDLYVNSATPDTGIFHFDEFKVY
ncbi:hypothetical protein [Paenibacillus agaridevorans]|uniref:hypothetical protein n=1 Tax=Paenibacillus agaridevorans TaxID=171404 RepID=UPI001BE4CA7A|nr:hypothetical protein [Paenibacillus agaridevorans]